jgi:putative toxin-antitoxin system antitoxin component (TIGR02293 family)
MPTVNSDVQKLDDLQSLGKTEVIRASTDGLTASLVRELAARMGVTMEETAELLRLTPRTLQRRLGDGVPEFAESERLWEPGSLLFRASGVLESEAVAVQWFKSPIRAPGWATPILFARSVGLRELGNILGRIEHGVFS